MPKNEKITVPQFTIFVTLYTIGTSILIAPNILVYFGKNDGWISMIINLLIGFSLIVFYNKIAKSLQQKSSSFFGVILLFSLFAIHWMKNRKKGRGQYG